MDSQSLPVSPEYVSGIKVFGVGGGGCHAIDHMIERGLSGVEFIAADFDAMSLGESRASHRVVLGHSPNERLGFFDSRPSQCRAAAEESFDAIVGKVQDANMVFITGGMGGSTGSGAAPVIARAVREQGILTVGVVTKPFHFEGAHRMRTAEAAIEELSNNVDSLIVIPSQSMLRITRERSTFAEAFGHLDAAQLWGVQAITDSLRLGMINVQFLAIHHHFHAMGQFAIGFGEADDEKRGLHAAVMALGHPFLDEASPDGARSIFVNVSGGLDMRLSEVDDACFRIQEYAGARTGIILTSTFEERLNGKVRVTMIVSHDRA